MNISKSLVILSTLVLALAFKVKQEKIKIWTEQPTLSEVIDFEKSIKKKINLVEMNVSLSKSIYPLLDQYEIANPLIVERKQTGFLPLYTEYFFSEPDSIIRYISYDWEKEKYGNFFKKRDIWKEESKKLNEYNNEYEGIKEVMVGQLGTPISQDFNPMKTKSSAGRGDYLTRNTVWETDEYYSELDMIFESMTYRIRWSYYWKK